MTDITTKLGWKPEERTALGVARAVSRAIRDGILIPGTKLPPIRTVARELQLSPTTVHSAWSLLLRSGAIHTDGRRGTIITGAHPGAARYRWTRSTSRLFDLDLSTGIPDPKLLPDLKTALKKLNSTAVSGGYLDEPAIPELIEILMNDWPYDTPNIMISDGAMDALSMAIKVAVQFGDRVIVEDPSLMLLLDQLDAIGAEVIGVPIDNQGLQVAPLAKALEKPAAAVILQPRAQNPTGISLTPSRASELSEVLEATNAVIIEDDSAGQVAFTPAISLGQWLPNQTIHIRSFSKSHGADLRLAAMSGPSTIIQEIILRRQLEQGWSSRLLQRILLGFLTGKHAVNQVEHARQEYKRRRDAFVKALATHDVSVKGSDGFNIWVPVINETIALMQLASKGIGAAPGAPFMVNQGQPDHIRLSIGSIASSHAELAETVATAAHKGKRNRWMGL